MGRAAKDHIHWLILAIAFVAVVLMLFVFAGPARGAGDGGTGVGQLIMPIPDAERGRGLFIVKGCVVCHSVNGVGGHAAPTLDALAGDSLVDPLGFASRMWRGALAMADLQATELGYQIELSGQEIADLAAFAANADEQSLLQESDIPELMRGWTIDDP